MSELNNSLLGYLKKKSLFSQSPIKSIHLKQRSKDKKLNSSHNNNSPHNKTSRSSKNLIHQTSFRNFKQQNQSDVGYQSLHAQRVPSRFNNTQSYNNRFHKQQEQYIQEYQQKPVLAFPKRNFNTPSNTKSVNVTKYQEDNTNLWTGLVNYSNSFQSARLQSAQCLQTMSIKLRSQLSNISYKIDIFHNKLVQILTNQLTNAKQKIYQIVNKIFQQSEQNIRTYIKQQQQKIAHDLLKMKDVLTKQYNKIEIMKQEINKSHWKKITGELLSTQLEEKIQRLLIQSREIDVNNWEVADLGIKKVASLEGQLREIIKFSTK